MAFSSIHNEILRSVTWVPIRANTAFGHETHLVKSVFNENSYLVLVTNLRYVWFEELPVGEIKKRFQELKFFLDVERLPEYIQFLSEYLQRQDIEHKVTKQDNILSLESKRSVGPMDLVWNFLCALIPNSSPNATSNEFIDGATVLYTHFVMPQLLLSSAYNRHIDALHDSIKSREEQFKETVRLMTLINKSGRKNDSDSVSFNPDDSYQEIERIISNFDSLENELPLGIHRNPTYSRLFQKATERVISQNFLHRHSTPGALSNSSSVPSIFELERASSRISQCSTIKLPSFSQSQLSEIFTPQLSAESILDVSSPVRDVIRSNVGFDRASSFTSNSDESRAEKERIQRMEEELRAESDARELKIRQELKEMDRRNAEKTVKKRKKIH